jgi:hypothetical protein
MSTWKLTRVFALIAPDRFSGFQGIQLIQAEPQNTADSGWRDADLRSDLLSRPALAAKPFDLFDDRLRRRSP